MCPEFYEQIQCLCKKRKEKKKGEKKKKEKSKNEHILKQQLSSQWTIDVSINSFEENISCKDLTSSVIKV